MLVLQKYIFQNLEQLEKRLKFSEKKYFYFKYAKSVIFYKKPVVTWGTFQATFVTCPNKTLRFISV